MAMCDTTTTSFPADLDQTEEEALTSEVCDEALEAAARMIPHYSFYFTLLGGNGCC
jgi:hypothetical protein